MLHPECVSMCDRTQSSGFWFLRTSPVRVIAVITIIVAIMVINNIRVSTLLPITTIITCIINTIIMTTIVFAIFTVVATMNRSWRSRKPRWRRAESAVACHIGSLEIWGFSIIWGILKRGL